MASITKKQFLLDVRHEIDMLKQHATAEELGRLDFKKFAPSHMAYCIYGQITGRCTSERAHELMDLCCVRQMCSDAVVKANMPIDEVLEYVNGAYNGATWVGTGRYFKYMSALEGYINLKGAKNAEIIAYMKGETKTLTL